MTKVCVFDPATGSGNLGDRVIFDSVIKLVSEIFDEAFIINIAIHQSPSPNIRRYIAESDFTFVAGSNMLKNWHLMSRRRRWHIAIADILNIQNVILFGPGWSNSKFKLNFITSLIFKKVLHKTMYHSVRDSFSQQRLLKRGISNVLNTACPTMWNLTPDHCKDIDRNRAKSVVTTLSDYHPDRTADKSLLTQLGRLYDKVYFWPQGWRDIDYIRSLEATNISILPPSLAAYDELLSGEDSLDYVGTRLHGGIRALQHKRRSLILSIDSRASEISRDTGLLILERGEISRLSQRIEESFGTSITLPEKDISFWKQQFRSDS